MEWRLTHLVMVASCMVLFAVGLSLGAGTPPRITEHPTDELVARGQPVTLNCKAEGDPAPQVTWFKGGRPLAAGDGEHRYFLHGSSLYFVEVVQSRRDDDAGTYWCQAHNTNGVARSRNATLEIAVLRDEFRTSPRDLQVAQTETARLQCDPPRGRPPARVTWLRNGEPLDVAGSRRLRQLTGGDLVVSDVRHHDEGAYTCVATNVAGERRSRPARLTVHVKPFFLRGPADVTAAVSRRVQLTCQVSGDPQPTIVWRRVGAELPVGRVHVTDDKSLRIDDIRLDDEGDYVCRAENGVGSVTGTARLSVTAPPVITSRATITESDVSEPVALDCRAEGRPPPLVYWLREGRAEPLTPGPHHTLGANGSLVLARPRPGDQGYYLCGAVSSAGADLLRLELLLRSQPAARLPEGRQQARQLLDRRPLGRLTARLDPAGAALLVWTRPVGAPAVDGYYVRYREAGGGPLATVTVPDGQATSHRLTALRSHTEYQAIVSAFYRGAEGRAAPLVTFRTPQDVPSSAPEAVTARVVNDTSVLLQWRPPAEEHRNGVIVGYQLLLLSNASVLQRNFSLADTTTARLLTELAPHTRYWVQVAAVTPPGAGPMAPPVGFTTGGPAAAAADPQQRVLNEAWFIALLGFLVFVVVSLLVGLVYVKRQHGLKQALTATPGKPRHEAVWVDRGWRPADSDKDSSLSEQKLLGYAPAAAALCAEYAELDQARDDGPYASACVIRQNPLSRLWHEPAGHATPLSLVPTGGGSLNLATGSGGGGRGAGAGRGGFPTMPAGRDVLAAVRPSLADMLPPPPQHPPPDHGGERLPAAGRYHQCGAQCVECSCSEAESSYDNQPRERDWSREREREWAPRTEPCQRRRPAADSDTYYGIPAGGGTFGAPHGRRLPRPAAGGPVEKLA